MKTLATVLVPCLFLVSGAVLAEPETEPAQSEVLSEKTDTVLEPESIEFESILAGADISAIERIGDSLYLASDELSEWEEQEANWIQHFELRDGSWSLQQNVPLQSVYRDEEMDVEAITASDNILYVLGSHSAKRKKVNADKSYSKNRRRMESSAIKAEPSRDQLVMLRLDGDREIDQVSISLRDLLQRDPVLSPFSTLASKENGIDIEGMSHDQRYLLLGFRGPILRGNWVPILALKKDNPLSDYRLSYINLDGLGVRAMAPLSDGHLVLAGPMGDAVEPYRLYRWNGRDMLPGGDLRRRNRGRIELLHQFESLIVAPEGLTVVAESEHKLELLLAFDGVSERGSIQRLVLELGPTTSVEGPDLEGGD